MLLADAHVHIYPCYSFERLLDSAFANLGKLQKDSGCERCDKALFLAERFDCDFWSALKTSGEPAGGGVRLRKDGDSILVFPGHQIVTEEKIEVLSLLCEKKFPDGAGLDSILSKIVGAGGLPVLCWAPGKWTVARGALVRKVMKEWSGLRIFAGDSALRCCPIPEPDVFHFGCKVLAGSDPLPFAGDEAIVGSYGISAEVEFESMETLSRDLSRPDIAVSRIGSRCGIMNAFARFSRNEYIRRFAGS